MMMYVNDDSEILVNLSSNENNKLNKAAIIKMVTTPYMMAEPKFFVPI